MKRELAENAKTIEELIATKEKLSMQCESLCSSLAEALEANESQKHEKVAWEEALLQAGKE